VPEPLGRGQRYIPGLDGLRAVAVTGVIIYHLGLPWLPGGLLGVAIFFTLSGYLITDLLLGSWEKHGSLRLREFWARRARRLLPALLVLLAIVSTWVAFADRSLLAPMRGAVFAALGYISNWYLVFRHISYFSRFQAPGPLDHLWSLAVEEQFYLIWPWLLLAALYLLRRMDRTRAEPGSARARSWRGSGGSPAGGTNWFGVPPSRRPLRPLMVATLVLGAASAMEMAVLYRPGFDSSRLYYGTDTRAFGLLAGAALAMVWPTVGAERRLPGPRRAVLDLAGVVGLAGCVVLMATVNDYSWFLYPLGLVLVSAFTVLVLASVSHPASRFGRVLGMRPLRWLGVRSYGVYLWHVPVIALTDPPPRDAPSGWLQAGQVLLTLALAAASWRFVESPVRQGAVGKAWSELRSGAVANRRWVAIAVVPLVAVFSAVSLSGLGHAGQHLTVATRPARTGASTYVGRPSATGRSITARPTTTHPTTTQPTTTHPTTTHPTTTHPTTASPATTLRTRCTSVVHIGDSTSASLVSADYLPDPAQRLAAQYARVGVKAALMRIVGGTSVVETLPGDQNAVTMAKALVSHGYRGCWVIALGTNDAADIYVGSNVGAAQRVQRMMAVIGGQPVLWVNVKTLLTSGPYAEANMKRWDQALVSACRRYPNLEVFDWASMANQAWFTDDGIHYNSPGSAPRAAAIADALAAGFPLTGHAPAGSCVVHGSPAWHLPVFHD
jgi:peptidoglycan/LPS O-acetylase OafA/YrhL